ncbi:MAG: molybdopterin-dependent oxidoreductase [Deltaproteobacteria bacterium]|nr:molybdopterin-dependent oxidoreductase [Deltaproteobacteria bacterium]
MVLETYSPEKVAEITEVDAETITTVARDFARAKAPVALCGKGKGVLNGSLFESMAVHALNALVGNINRPGGPIVAHDLLPLGVLPDVELDMIAEDGLKRNRLDKAGTRAHPFTHSMFSNFVEAAIKGAESPVDTLFVFSSNPGFTLPDGGDFMRCLEKIPFIASFSPYHDETAYMADLILPDHNYLEKMDDVVWPSGLQYPLYGLTRPVVDPLYDTMNTGDVLIRLAKGIGGSVGNSFPWKKYEEILKIRVKGLFDSGTGLTGYDSSFPAWERSGEGVTPDYDSFDKMWEKIKTGGLWYLPVRTTKNRKPRFDTPSGKFEFFSSRIELAAKESNLKEMGISAVGDEAFMPHYEPTGHDEEKRYPLQMVPYEMINLSSGWLPSPPYLYKTLFDDQLLKDESFIEINPKTASEYNLKDGDRVYVESHKGKLQVRINLFEGAMPGVIYMPLGFGHTAYDDFLQEKGVNPNQIVNGGRDPLSGHPVWWDTPVKLTKI